MLTREEYFDATHYVSQMDPAEVPANPLEHYRTVGAARGLSPSPYFDVPWYVMNNPDVAEFNGNVLDHYLARPAGTYIDTHPIFRAKWYAEQYLSGVTEPVDPLHHYITQGWQAGHRPTPLFWGEHYARTYLDGLTRPVDPLMHFIQGGWRSCNPNPLFDTRRYGKAVKGPANPDPLSHYIHVGFRDGLSPHPLFDPGYVLAQAKLDPEEIAVSPLEIFLNGDTGADPHPLFDSSYFESRLASTGAALPTDVPAVVTYLARGYRDVVDPHPFFSKAHYYRHAPDVYGDEQDALVHFVSSGFKENREVHPLFSQAFYREQVGEGFGGNALLHYLGSGLDSDVHCRPWESPDQTMRALPGARIVTELATDHAEPTRDLAGDAPHVGCFFHIFYPELAAEMLAAANNIPAPCTVFITTDSLVKSHEIATICGEVLKHPHEIRVVPNRGRDIAPMIVGFADRLREVDYGVHLHSKRSMHYAKEFASWRRHLVEGALGSPELVSNILDLLAREEIGAVAPEHYYPIRSLIQWGGNFDNLSALMSLMGEDVHRETTLDFPSGSMFWFKTRALAPLLDLNLTYHHFDPEMGQYDGTLAHAIERAFFMVVEAAGYEYAVIDPKPRAQIKGPVPPAQAGNRFFVTERDKGSMHKHYPETTRFLVRRSEVEKPRINLLIPTVDTGMAYAGVATALDVFHAIRAELGPEFDGRMIATDMTPGNQYCPPPGYEMASLVDADAAGVDTVLDAARRFHAPFQVRRSDVFLATAWWTAMNGFNIMGQQAQLHGSAPASLAYLIQDDERGFYAWSTKYALADATYRRPETTIPIFNTELLFEDFRAQGRYDTGHALKPPINTGFSAAIQRDRPKEKLVLLYARPHAERNCLPFLDAMISEAVARDPALWDGWRFLAIGEDFDQSLLSSNRIEVLGRLTIDEYAALASRAALAVSLMVSPHPSYPPLEMAEAGAIVLANTYGEKDLTRLHDNIRSFDVFSLNAVSAQLCDMGRAWTADPAAGWSGAAKVDWFFGGQSNLPEMARAVAEDIRKTLP